VVQIFGRVLCICVVKVEGVGRAYPGRYLPVGALSVVLEPVRLSRTIPYQARDREAWSQSYVT
jgi:hypothetical protein